MRRLTKLLKQSKKSFLDRLFIACFLLLALLTVISVCVNVAKSKKYENIIEKWSNFYQLDKDFVFAVVKTESDFNENAKSEKGAIGLMQIKQSTFDYMIEKYRIKDSLNIANADDNVRIGCCYLNYLFQKFFNEKEVLCAYNAGEGNVQKWLNNNEFSGDGKSLDVIPFDETRRYVKKVLTFKTIYGGV